ncbi:O-antigen ligase family protein [Coleofasciculus chthonoplastes]|uniref:O-antigen ligase family protein n=1 Tax=Coleofasciculus chthonoplastes TaxID=64178 RepID=UPI003303372B
MKFKSNLLLRNLICAYIFFASWTDSFSLSEKLPLHIVILGAIVVVFIMAFLNGKKILSRAYKPEDFLVILCFIGVCLSGVLNPNGKTVNYVIAYFAVFIIGYLLLKGIVAQNINWQTLLKINTIALIFAALFTISEFLIEFLTGFDIQTFIPRENPARATYLLRFPRAYGFAHEPTILAFYFNTLGPIGLWKLWHWNSIGRVFHRYWLKISLTLIAIFAWFSTFSAAGFVFLPCSLILANCLKKRHKFSRTISPRLIFLVVLSIVLVTLLFSIVYLNTFQSREIINEYTDPLRNKITLQSDGQASRRVTAWINSLDNIPKSPVFGRGVGSQSDSGLDSSFNWYLFLMLEGGLISFLPIAVFLCISFLRITVSHVQGKIWFMTGFLAGAMHLLVISTFYHPFLWILLIIFSTCSEQQKIYE